MARKSAARKTKSQRIADVREAQSKKWRSYARKLGGKKLSGKWNVMMPKGPYTPPKRTDLVVRALTRFERARANMTAASMREIKKGRNVRSMCSESRI